MFLFGNRHKIWQNILPLGKGDLCGYRGLDLKEKQGMEFFV